MIFLVASCGGRSLLGSARDNCPAGDADGDCQVSMEEGGRDCDDADPTIFAGAPDNGPGATLAASVIVDWQDLPFPFCEAMDRQGALHILGGDGLGLYATNRSGTWETQWLDQDPPSGYCNLFVDRAGIHVLSSGGTLEPPVTYSFHPGPSLPEVSFTHETVTDSGVVSRDLWRSPGGRTFVSYLSEATGVIVAERTGDGWRGEHIGDLPGWGDLSLSGSDEGEPWLLSNRLRDIFAEAFFSARSGGSWSDQRLSEDATSNMALALAQHHAGAPELAFQYSRHGSYGPPGRFSRVEYRTLRNGNWEGTVVDDQFWVDCMDIGTDGNDLLRLALLGHGDQTDGSARELRVYEKRPEGWALALHREIDHAVSFSFCRLYLDASGAVTLLVADEESRVVQADNRSLPDGIDQNCDGVDGVDADRDGIASFATGGQDDDE